jgi:hypothetical protein
VNAPRAGDWPFSALLPVMSADPEGGDRRARDLARQLKASRMLFGKVWVLVPWLGAAAIALGLAGVAAGGWWVYENWRTVYPLRVDLGVVDIVAALGVLAACALLPLGKFIKPVDTFRKWLFLVVLATAGWAATNLYLLLLDPLYRRRGKLERLIKLPAE